MVPWYRTATGVGGLHPGRKLLKVSVVATHDKDIAIEPWEASITITGCEKPARLGAAPDTSARA